MSKFDKIVKDYDNKLSLLTNEIDRFRGLAEKRKLEYDEIIIKYSQLEKKLHYYQSFEQKSQENEQRISYYLQ